MVSELAVQILGELRPYLIEMVREMLDAEAAQFKRSRMMPGQVRGLDLNAGVANVLIDGDDDDIETLIIGPAPSLGSRVVILFVPPSGAYLLGGVGPAHIRLPDTADVALDSDDHPFQVGDDTAANLAIDTNEIQARDNGAAGSLSLNHQGGPVNLAGRWRAGSAPDDPDTQATLARIGQFTTSDWAVRQQSDGDVILNAPLGKDVWIYNAGTLTGLPIARFTATGTVGRVRFPSNLVVDTAAVGQQVYLRGSDLTLYHLSSTLADKTDIGPADRTALLTAVEDLKLYEYRRPDSSLPERRETGLIAEWAPAEFQVRDGNGQPIDVDRDGLLMALVGAVQELSARLTSRA